MLFQARQMTYFEIDNCDKVSSFFEKPKGDGSWINGGFFVCEPDVFDFIDRDNIVFEKYPMEKIAEIGRMGCFKHEGFWKPTDTLRDKYELENMWNNGKAPWKNWV